MRSSLTHAISERRRLSGGSLLRRSRDHEPVARPEPSGTPQPTAEPTTPAPETSSARPAPQERASGAAAMAAAAGAMELADLASERARAAGGPLDVASYTCPCGEVFCADVSTTVACPHCGAEQEW